VWCDTGIVINMLQVSPLNLFTSFCFIWTAGHALLRDCHQIFLGCVACLFSSVLYHGFYVLFKKPFTPLRIIDMTVTQFCIIYFSFMCYSSHWLYWVTVSCVIYLGLFYWIFNKSHQKDGFFWHSTLHIVGNFGISCLIESCVNTPDCHLCYYNINKN